MATYYANADSGSDSNTGGITDPFLTVAKFVTIAVEGDTLICQKSTNTFIWATIAPGKGLTIKSDTLLDAVFDGGGAAVEWRFDGAITQPITIENLIFQNAVQVAGPPGYVRPYVGIRALASADYVLNITNCRFISLPCGNSLTNNQSGTGIVGINADTSLANSASINLSSVLFFNPLKPSGGSVNNSIISSPSASATFGTAYKIYNCIVYHIEQGGVDDLFYLASSLVSADIKNTVIYSADSLSFNGGTAAFDPMVFNNNLTYNVTSVPSGSNNIIADPKFVDALNINFNPRQSSPLIDAGVAI